MAGGVIPDSVDLTTTAIRVGHPQQLDGMARSQLESQLQILHPWRKGPFDLFGVYIDTEWRSDWKWDRLVQHITPLQGRVVLDVGSGSGYHCWRMAGAGAQRVIGIEPMILYVMQYQALQHYIQHSEVHVLPLGTDDMPAELGLFDTVFSMGLLYHQREPQQHLQALRRWLRPGGELVLETLVIEARAGEVLLPQGRYASMRNVWAIPAVATLQQWLADGGYHDIRCVDVNVTRIEEQRATGWMRYQSLADYLDPHDLHKTIEGYPAPRRAILIAQAPA
jgi:tRNA (mo5U34)-methyltransferase